MNLLNNQDDQDNQNDNCTSSDCGCEPTVQLSSVNRRSFIATTTTVLAGLATSTPVFGAQESEQSKSYAAAVKSHEKLKGYWSFNGDLKDQHGKKDAKSSNKLQWVNGATTGQSLKVSSTAKVSVPDTYPVGHGEATLELFFKLNELPDGTYDPVVISQGTEKKSNFTVRVKRDLSGLTYTDHKYSCNVSLMTGEKVEIGRWYHLALVSIHLDLRIFVDGHDCALNGTALHFSSAEKDDTSELTFGAASIGDRDGGNLELDEVAFYLEAITAADIEQHLRAAGWGERFEATGKRVEQFKAKLAKTRLQRQQELLNDPALLARGETKTYEGEHLGEIVFSVGGIGSGGIFFDGHAQRSAWQLACNADFKKIDDSFLAVRAQASGQEPVVRALQTKSVGPFKAMKSLRMTGEYPFANYHFDEPALPVEISLEVFNPFTPMDAKSSAIPCVIQTVTATNNSASPVTVDVLAAQKNIAGYSTGQYGGRPAYGGNENKVVRDGDTTMLHMTRQNDSADLVLMTQAADASANAQFDSADSLHADFSSAGKLEGVNASKPSADMKTVNGAIAAPLKLEPGESRSVTIVLTWFMPKTEQGARRKKPSARKPDPKPWEYSGNMYSNWWPNALEVAKYLNTNLDELTKRTRRFHEAIYDSNLPGWLLDRLTAQLAILRTQTCFWAEDGYFGVFEGVGCCDGNCAHVWQYAQGHARLFPEIGRKMREQDYDHMVDGRLLMRHGRSSGHSADGHFGALMATYREHLCSADPTWIKERWASVKAAMEWAIKTWDPDMDGFMEGRQPNTLDCTYSGCSSWIGSMYLSTLEAIARIADTVGEQDLADKYRRIRVSGKELQNKRLWNGEYYIQLPGEGRSSDYLDGCHIDQILGEWWGGQIGVDHNFPIDRSRQAMKSLLKYNFKTDFAYESLKPRQFVIKEDAGTKMITWPNNPQPTPSMKYGDEVMTGFEYSAGTAMIQCGMMHEGLMVIKAVYDRYDGRLKTEEISKIPSGPQGRTGNPFGDDECGKFYGRALSVWSALLVLQGFDYDGPAGRIGFAPRWQPEDHASFFTVAEGYGLFTQKVDGAKCSAAIDLRDGSLMLSEVTLAGENKTVTATLAGKALAVSIEVANGKNTVTFDQTLTIKAGQKLELKLS